MKYPDTTVRKTVPMLVSALVMASFSFVALADNSVSKNAISKPARVVAIQNAFQPSGQQLAASASPLSLLIESPDSGILKLTYTADRGWSLTDNVAAGRGAHSGLNLTAMPQPEKKHALNDPQTVFIDGPTGYTFMWTPDTGWKFIGRIAEPKP